MDVFLFWSETIFAMSLLHAVREGVGAIIPDTFISRMHYTETIFLKDSSRCLLEDITTYKLEHGSCEFCLKDLINILCGIACKVNLLKLVPKPNKQNCTNSVERILVLSFLVLCNLGGTIKLQDSAITKLAHEVAETLQSTKKEEALNEMKASRKALDFINPLQCILEEPMHLKICTWTTKFAFQSIKSSNGIENDLPTLLLNEETLERIQNPSKSDSSSTKSTSCEDENDAISSKEAYAANFPELRRDLKPQTTSCGDIKHKTHEGKAKQSTAVKIDSWRDDPQKYTILYQRNPDVNAEMNIHFVRVLHSG
jgi:hypothetical protein